MPQDVPSLEDLHKLLEAAKPELQAVELPRRPHRIVTRMRVIELTQIMRASWAPLVDALDQILSAAEAEQRKSELARLESRAWVCYAADLAAEGPNPDLDKSQRLELAAKVAEHDRFLLGWATPLFGDDPAHAATLRDISRGTGRRDDAEDVQRLVALFRDNWSQVENNPWVTKAYLDEAAVDATRQLRSLSEGKNNHARKLTDAAYWLWYVDYDELMHLGRYLARREDDARVRFPGVREAMPSAKPADASTQDQAPETEAPETEAADDAQQDADPSDA